MRKLRENTKWIMLFTALAFVGLMVFEWGMDLTGRSGTELSGGEVGRVNRQAVPYEEWATAYRTLYDQQVTPGQPPTAALNRQIEDAAWEQLVMQRLISEEMRRRGIRVTRDEIRQAARFAPPPEFQSHEMFQTDGQFDFQKYHSFLSSPMVDTDLLLQLEAYYRDAIPRSKLYYQTTAGVFVTDSELWRMWRDMNESVRVRYIAFDPAALVPEAGISVNDAEIRAYYEAHRGDFLRPAQATVKYLVMDRSPMPADSAAALQKARELRAEIVGDLGFEAVARREAADSVVAAQGGRSTIVRGQTYPAVEQMAFSLQPGTVSQPILTPAGYHILQVDSRTDDQAEVRQILVPITLSEEGEDILFDRADSLDVLAGRMRLDDIAREFGLEARTADLIPGLSFLPGVGMADDGLDWVFEDAQPGEVSEVFETPGAYYMLELVQRQPERTLSLAEATPTVRTALIAEKRLERATETVRQARDRTEAGESFEQVAAATGGQVEETALFTRGEFVPGLGRLNPAIGTAFGLRTGQTSGVVESERQLYIIQLVERQDPDRAAWEAQKEEQRQRVMQSAAEQRWNNFLAALRENAEVVDGRRDLTRRMAQGATLF